MINGVANFFGLSKVRRSKKKEGEDDK